MKSFKQKTNVVEEQEEYKDDLTVLKEAGLLETSAMGEVPPEPEEPIGNHKVPPKPIEFIDEQVTKPVVLDPPKRPILSFESFSDGESTTTTEALIARNPEMSLEQVEDAIEEEIVSNEVEEVEIVEEPVLKIPTKKPTKVEIAFESALKGSNKHSFLEIFFLSNNLLNKTHSLLNELSFFSKNDKAWITISFTFSIGLLIDFKDNKLTEAWQ